MQDCNRVVCSLAIWFPFQWPIETQGAFIATRYSAHSGRVARWAQTDPNFAANVGDARAAWKLSVFNSVRRRTETSLEFEILLQGNPSSCPTPTCTKEATDTVRNDHAQIPRLAPGLNVADPRVSLEIAQVPAGLSFLNLVLMAPFFWEERCKSQEISSTTLGALLCLTGWSKVSDWVRPTQISDVYWLVLISPAGECAEIFWSHAISPILGQFPIWSGAHKRISN